MDKTFQVILGELRKPFAPELIEWKPQSTGSSQCMVAAFVDPRHYQERLDAACPEWNVRYQFIKPDGSLVICTLTLAGIVREDVGESDAEDKNTATSALAQSFKRACTAVGLGRDLYFLPKQWVAYDPQSRRITGKPTLPEWYIKGERPLAIAQDDGALVSQSRPSKPTQNAVPSIAPTLTAPTGSGDLIDEINRRVSASNDESADRGWNTGRLASEPQAKAVAICLNKTLGGDEQRKKFMALAFGVESGSQLTMNQASVILNMLTVKDEGGNWDNTATNAARADFARRCGEIRGLEKTAAALPPDNSRDIPW